MKLLIHSFSLFFFASFATLVNVVAQDCFNSTLAVLEAQVLETRPNSERKVYTFCPDLSITVGFPTDATLTDFVNGDFPLTVLRPNTTIEGNGLVLQGGLNQFGVLAIYQISGLLFTDPKEGTILSDITFDGSGSFSVADIGSYGIFISAPGDYAISNVRFQDFNFPTSDCSSRPMYVGENSLLPGATPASSIEVTIEGATFIDSASANCSSVVFNANQTLNMRNIVLDNVEGGQAVSLRGSQTEISIENMCVISSTFNRTVFFQNELGNTSVFSVSGIFIDEATEFEFCPEETNLIIFSDEETSVICDTVPTVDSCFTDETTSSPTSSPTPGTNETTSNMPTETPTSAVPTEAPSGTMVVGSLWTYSMSATMGVFLVLFVL